MFEVSYELTRKYRRSKRRHSKDEIRSRQQQSSPSSPSESISVQHLTVFTPDNRALMHNLSFDIEPNCNFLVTGPSGCGKSTLLKVLHGIWPYYDGSLQMPTFAPTQIQYLPQKPYICHHMSLSEQITYPFLQVNIPRHELERMPFGFCHLSCIMNRIRMKLDLFTGFLQRDTAYYLGRKSHDHK